MSESLKHQTLVTDACRGAVIKGECEQSHMPPSR